MYSLQHFNIVLSCMLLLHIGGIMLSREIVGGSVKLKVTVTLATVCHMTPVI